MKRTAEHAKLESNKDINHEIIDISSENTVSSVLFKFKINIFFGSFI
jgi:hypothetical protein